MAMTTEDALRARLRSQARDRDKMLHGDGRDELGQTAGVRGPAGVPQAVRHQARGAGPGERRATG